MNKISESGKSQKINKNRRGSALFYALAWFVALLLVSGWQPAWGAAHEEQSVDPRVLAVPVKAVISPHGARLDATQEIEIVNRDGQPTLEFVIPADAENLSLSVADHTIARWSMSPVILHASSHNASVRTRAEHTRDELISKLTTVKAQLAVWEAQTSDANPQDLQQRQSLMQSQMPALVAQREALQRNLTLVERELSEMPSNPGVGQLVTVTLTSASKIGERAKIIYSYDLTRAGWQAVYDFNAMTDNDSGDMVNVRLLAEVWQYTGMDWTGTEINLVTIGGGPREPAPLVKWVVGAPAPEARPAPRAAKSSKTNIAAGAQALKAAPVAEMEDLAPPVAPVSAHTDSVYASWALATRGLPEGRSRIAISSDTWKAPLQWLARPSVDNNRVWLLAKYDLPPNQAWPTGIAQFSVDGQNVGDGVFNPRGREATLYFGADPRVNVHTTVDSNRQGETGFINTSKTWTGAWTYTISNQHDKAVKVRVERPAPMLANDDITVSYKDTPPSEKDEKEHMVYWLADVPAHGKTVIQHSVTISSPEKLPLLPDVP